MVKKYNQYTLENYFKMLTIQTGRKNPCDIMEFLEEEYYSQSKKENVKYKDMDITHLIRVMLNASEDVESHIYKNDSLIDEVKRLQDKIKKLTKVLED
jgi:predicted RNase H-like nuclease (RuvC/YqgF family)|tara:strand:+ start:89 stop:382 length:294 start_codon:yes stop_codon:yes gene_type:complete